jgi:hypothetical protein
MEANAKRTTVTELYSTLQTRAVQMVRAQHLMYVLVSVDIMEVNARPTIAMEQYLTHHLCVQLMEHVLHPTHVLVNQVSLDRSAKHGHVTVSIRVTI